MAEQDHACGDAARRADADGVRRASGPSVAEIGFAVSVDLPTSADVERAFATLSKGGTVTMPVGETFFAKSFGMLTDRFGVPWMIICPKPM